MWKVGGGKKFARSVSHFLVNFLLFLFLFVIMRYLFLGTKSIMQREL